MYQVGEALVGKEPEVAHVDLIVGSKEGPAGVAFASGLANLSAGHTPLLAIIRPNLPTKPHTLIIPKVTVKDLEQAGKIFGPAQAAVAKAVADAVEEGILPAEKIDEWVIVCSVFIHPEAKDYRKIYHYNYGATKLALKRALTGYPSLDKLMFDKDRATHAIMGFRVPRLWMPPYLQVSLDVPDLDKMKMVVRELPPSDRILLEVGSPLVKKYGLKVISELRELSKDSFIIADLKTLDVGQVEVDLAFEETADAVTASGLASRETLDKFIYETQQLGIYAYVDLVDVNDPIALLKSLKTLPEVVVLDHRVDAPPPKKPKFSLVEEIKKAFKGKRLLVALSAPGMDMSIMPAALEAGSDILVFGRYITQSKNPYRTASDMVRQLGPDMDLLRVHVE